MAFIGWLVLLIFLGVLLILLLTAAVFGPVLPSMILRASCSVADVKEPRYLVSFPLGYAILLVYATLCWAFVSFLGRFDVDPDAPFGSMHLCGYLLSFAVGWIVAALLYRASIAPSFLKGFWVASLQLLLGALASALTAGVLFAVLAVWQLLQFPLPWMNTPQPPPTALAAPAAVAPL
jgi:hypothetical protein